MKNEESKSNECVDFSTAVKVSVDGIAICKNTGEFIYVNDATVRMFGYDSPEELLGKSWKVLYEEKDVKSQEETVGTEFFKKGFWQGEIIGKKRDGSKIYQELSLTLTEDGRIVRIVRDISKRKFAEKALEESNLKYQSLIDNLQEAVLYADEKNNIIYANKQFCKMLGYTSGELLNTNSNDMLYDNKDLKSMKEKAKLRKLGISDSYEIRFKKKNGEMIWCHINGTPNYDINGNIVGYIRIITDITEQKKSKQALREVEKKYQALVNTSPDGILVTDVHDKITLVNRRAVEMFCFDKATDMIGKNSLELFSKEDYNRIKEALVEIYNEGIIKVVEFKMLRKDGSEFPVEISTALIKNIKENPKGTISVIRDITERRKIEKQLMKNVEEQKEINATKDKLYSIIAHDLRSPFQVLKGYSELLRINLNNSKPKKILDYAENIYQTSSETCDLLDNLLQWTAIQSGRIKPSQKMLYVNDLFNTLIKINKKYFVHKKIVLLSTLKKDIFIYADRNMIMTILQNFVSNAIKFTKRKGRIVLEAKEKDEKVLLTVSDTGIGITKGNIANLFKIDASITTRGTEKEKGTGLGLIICKEFADSIDGIISVQSKPGKGSKFTLSLPVNKNLKLSDKEKKNTLSSVGRDSKRKGNVHLRQN